MNTEFIKQFTVFLWNRFMKGISLFGTAFFYIVFWLFLFEVNPVLAIKTLPVFIFIEIFTGIIKILFPKHRPIPGNHNTILDKYEAGSFPSIHAARISALAILATQIFPDTLHIKFYSFCLVIFVSLSRVYTKRHYWSDVIAGIIIGAATMNLAFHITV